jgi:hypothetical protein
MKRIAGVLESEKRDGSRTRHALKLEHVDTRHILGRAASAPGQLARHACGRVPKGRGLRIESEVPIPNGGGQADLVIFIVKDPDAYSTPSTSLRSLQSSEKVIHTGKELCDSLA